MITTTTFRAPSHWAPYLINGDASGLEDEDIAECDAWVATLGAVHFVSCEDYGFTRYHDAREFAMACDCQDYTVYDNT
jgi:hypothetical protein